MTNIEWVSLLPTAKKGSCTAISISGEFYDRDHDIVVVGQNRPLHHCDGEKNLEVHLRL